MTKLDLYESRVLKLQEILAHYEIESECEELGPPKVFHIVGGTARVWKLFESEDVTVVKSHVTPNSEFPRHSHDEMVFIVLFKGYAVYVSDDVEDSPGRRLEMYPGQCVSVPIGKPHKIITEDEGAWFSVTTIPKGVGLL